MKTRVSNKFASLIQDKIVGFVDQGSLERCNRTADQASVFMVLDLGKNGNNLL